MRNIKIALLFTLIFIGCAQLRERKKERILKKFNKYFISDTLQKKQVIKGFDSSFYFQVNKQIDTFNVNVKNLQSSTILNLKDSTILQRFTLRDTFITYKTIEVKEKQKPIIDKVFKYLTLILVSLVILIFFKIYFGNTK